MMNEERYILAELKRWLVNTKEYFGSSDVLRNIAEIEANAILGEEFATDAAELPFQDEEEVSE